MIMGAIGNELNHDMIKWYFVDTEFTAPIRPSLAMETFSSKPRDAD